jgi:hypothetical protein
MSASLVAELRPDGGALRGTRARIVPYKRADVTSRPDAGHVDLVTRDG